MGKVPGTGKTPLEKIQEELQAEVEKWNELGMDLNQTVHNNQSVYSLKFQVQTLINVLISKGYATSDEFNLEFKTLILKDMQKIRAEHEPQIREERRQQILHGAKPDVAIPHLRLLGPDGKDLKI